MSKKSMKVQIRQGDVLVESCEEPTGELTPVEPEGGRVILAHGEATGHAHAIPMADAALLAKGAERFLWVQRRTQLKHDEHAPIWIEPGTYRVTRQREYTPEEIRNVAD
jgi:hypothetical protein